MFTKLCDCERMPCYNGNSACSLCLSEQAKQKRSEQRETAKQAKTLAKAKERSKGSNTALNPISKKQAAINAEKSRIKKQMQEVRNECFTCESAKGETLSHIITAKNKAFELIPANLVLECVDCHFIFEHDKKVYAKYWPDKWQQKLERAKKLSEIHYQQLLNQLEK
jgi:hypothetical protein